MKNINNMQRISDAFLNNLIPGVENTYSTFQAYKNDMNLFNQFLIRYKNISDIKEIDNTTLYDYKKYLYKEKQFEKTTVDRKIFCLKSFFDYATTYNYIDQNPMDKFKYKKHKGRNDGYLTEEELDIICNVPRKLYIFGFEMRQALIYTLRYTGARRETVLKLNWNDIHFHNKTITLTIGKQVDPEHHDIPMHDRLYMILLELYTRVKPKDDDPVFKSSTGNRLSNTGYNEIISEIIKASGIEKDFNISGHKFRASFITILSQKGWTIADIAELTLHKDLRTLYEYYIKSNKQRMEDAIHNLN